MSAGHRVIVIGAGPAGIASALALKDAGLAPLVLDRADQVASTWRSRYDGLRLNTWRRFSHLPDRPFPKGSPTFPTRDQLIEHLGAPRGRGGNRVPSEHRGGPNRSRRRRMGRSDERRRASRTPGNPRPWPRAEPVHPRLAGRADFEGTLIHSSEYRNAGSFDDQRVLVVGPGSSGMEIAHELAENEAAKVWLAVTDPAEHPVAPGPRPGAGGPDRDLALAPAHRSRRPDRPLRQSHGRRRLDQIRAPPRSAMACSPTRTRGKVPAIVDADVIEAIKDGPIEVVGAVQSLDSGGVRLADGMHLDPQSVICATGYRLALEPLVGHLGVLGERGLPRKIGPDPAAEGMRFIGYLPRPGGLGATWPRRQSEPPRRSPASSTVPRSRTACASRFPGAQRLVRGPTGVLPDDNDQVGDDGSGAQ